MSEIETTKTAKKSSRASKEAPLASAATDPSSVIGSPTPKAKRKTAPSMSSSEGTIGSSSAVSNLPGDTPELVESVEKVALFSTKNVSWPAVGKISKGYNIVSKEVADHWLTRSHIRLATPEEVKRELS
jgi:hypothetical protein